MYLLESLNSFCLEYFNETNEWYNWKVDESKIPTDIKLPIGNHYFKNISLKEELHKAWKLESDTKKKGEIIEYYIKVWGGIPSNSEYSMNDYMNSSPDSLIEHGKKGIASWSKALVIHNPEKYAIFDARVSISLNCLQIKYDIKNKVLFPMIGSRNKTITKGQKMIKSISKQDNWQKVNKSTFYIDYLKLLSNVANSRNTSIASVEMLLFAKAEILVNEINFA